MKNPALLALPLLIISACGSDTTSTTSEELDTSPVVSDDAIQTPATDQSSPVSDQQAPSTPDDNTSDNADESDTDNPTNASADDQPSTPADPPTEPDTDTDTDTGSDVADGCEVPAAGTTIVSKTTPVHPNDNPYYYPVMGPQCVVPGSQFDGPGLAYGDFLLTNNAWNGQQSTADWQQCINLTEATDGSVLASWDFDWGNEDDLQDGLFEWEVKSFPELIYGYKSNEEISGPCAATGLPVALSSLPDISIAYNYRAPLTDTRVGDRGDEANNPVPVTGGDRNIAIESFFHTSCDIIRGADSNMELELMVWLEMGNERLPSGQPPVAQYTSGTGQTYDVYTKSDNYVAYVAQNPETAGTINWTEFVNDTRDNATSYGVKTLQNNWCMANVIFGSEIWWGEGSVALDYYQITSQY